MEFIFGGLLLLIVLCVIGIVFYVVCSGSNANNDGQDELITYNQNGYHSDRSGYQSGKFTKNNHYNGS